MPRPKASPFQGDFNSTAFHARDATAINTDAQLILFQRFARVLEGQMDDDPAPCFAIARGVDPRAPFFILRQPAEVVIEERHAGDPEIDDGHGWIAMLQRHITPAEGLIVTEWRNPAAPAQMLTWALTDSAARCYLERP